MKRSERRKKKKEKKNRLTAANNLNNSRNDARLCVYMFVCLCMCVFALYCMPACVFGVLEQPEDTTALENCTKTWAEQSSDAGVEHTMFASLNAKTLKHRWWRWRWGRSWCEHVGGRATRRIPPKFYCMTYLIYSWHVATFPTLSKRCCVTMRFSSRTAAHYSVLIWLV